VIKRRLLAATALALVLATPAGAQSVQTFQYANITLAAPTTTTLKSSPGVLHCITLNKPAATGVITVYDNTAASGTTIGTITTPTSPQPVKLCYDVAFWTGLTIVTATAAQDVTVSFR
jgi:hypothetical protein